MSITASVAKVRLACQYAGNLILVISLETKYTNHVPETGLKGKFDGLAIRVPTVDVSLVDLTLETERPITKDAIHAAMKKAADEGPMQGVLDYTEEELVSGDYIGVPASSTFDASMTQVLGDRFAKIFSWYDNEWGFSNRMIDLSLLVAKKGV
jgi:glyceraldehyde 3-phosphate dehydrogenase